MLIASRASPGRAARSSRRAGRARAPGRRRSRSKRRPHAQSRRSRASPRLRERSAATAGPCASGHRPPVRRSCWQDHAGIGRRAAIREPARAAPRRGPASAERAVTAGRWARKQAAEVPQPQRNSQKRPPSAPRRRAAARSGRGPPSAARLGSQKATSKSPFPTQAWFQSTQDRPAVPEAQVVASHIEMHQLGAVERGCPRRLDERRQRAGQPVAGDQPERQERLRIGGNELPPLGDAGCVAADRRRVRRRLRRGVLRPGRQAPRRRARATRAAASPRRSSPRAREAVSHRRRSRRTRA